MKITEVMQKSDDTLIEEFNREGTNGFLAEDLVKVVRSHQNNEWSEGMSGDEFVSWMQRVVNGEE